jgi:histidinol phosphatase-like enzyme
MTAVEAVNRRVEEEFARFHVHFQRIYVAPEAPNEPSRGRKPSPQFLLDARDAFSLDLASSYLIGDKFSDLECGWNAGVSKCILVRTGYGARVESEFSERLGPAVVVNDLGEAADWIIERSQKDEWKVKK